MQEIINKVTNCPTISWDIIKKWEFNQLKDNSNRDVKKLKNSILKNGFIAPFDAWKQKDGKMYVIDGTGRNLALLQLQTEGYEIPELPVLFIEAKDLKEAKKFALQRSSTHGKITQSSLADFTSVDFELAELEDLAEEEINIAELDYFVYDIETSSEDQFNTNKSHDPNALNTAFNKDSISMSLLFKNEDYKELTEKLNQIKKMYEIEENAEIIKKIILDTYNSLDIYD